MKPLICILSDGTRPERRGALDELLAELQPQADRAGVPLFVTVDVDGKGSTPPWLQLIDDACVRADEVGATHFTFLPDDALLVPDFVTQLCAAIEAKPDDVLCFQSNHLDAPAAYEAGAAWYTTVDGCTLFGGTMPIALLREHIAWRKKLDDTVPVAGDLGVNLWCMATGRLIHKSLPSLVDHDTSLPSADGNDDHALLSPRRPLVWKPETPWKDGPTVHLGRTYKGNHWRLVVDVKRDHIDADLIERMYAAHRGGTLVSSTTAVGLCSATYREPHEIVRATSPSRRKVAEDLTAHGIGVTLVKAHGDSLPQRMRQRAVHEFLKTGATHLLWWDADVECVDPTVVRAMLASGHDVVCGAYPFKRTDGRCVLNMWPSDAMRFDDGEPVPEWLEVEHAGTGFMLVSRKCIVDLMARHPELMHLSQSDDDDRGAPLWAIYDTAIVDLAYLSEDYFFCRLVHDAGGQVWIYTPARFRHYGVYGYEGSIRAQFAAE